MSRFFEKSKHIESLSQKDITAFLSKEKLLGKVNVDRVQDFYNGLSSIMENGTVEREGTVDYDMFNCKTKEDFKKIDGLRAEEQGFLKRINKDSMSADRLLKAATALSYKFEKEHYSGSEVGPPDPNAYLSNLFDYSEEEESEEVAFGDMLDMDLKFMKYIALLANKKAFSKQAGKLQRDRSGKVIKYTPMEAMGDVISMDLLDCVLPNFYRKMATHDLYIKTRHVKVDRAQNLIIMVDDSGSMSSDSKPSMLKAALYLKLKDHSPEHNIYVGTFITENFGFQKIEMGTKFEDLSFIKLNKGGTNVNNCIKDVIDMIKKRKLKSFTGTPYDLTDDHFEIMVINDGQDAVDETFHPQIRMHALCLKESNHQLKNICHRSGGTFNMLK